MNPHDIEDLYELSPLQHGMLFHTIYAPKGALYFEQSGYSLGDLDVPAFERAWQKVVDRHPILRTSFYWEDLDKPLQAAHRRLKLPVEHHDWRTSTRDEQQKRLELLLQADRDRGFDLTEAPLMRLTLIRIGEDSHEFFWSWHHLLLDRWSRSLVFREVLALYEAYTRGVIFHLEGTRPYGDYIEWLQQRDSADAAAFWRRTLQGIVAPTSLGLPEKEATAMGKAVYDAQRTKLTAPATAALQAFARRHQITMNTLAQGAWALLLSRYCGEKDIVFGATVSGRSASLTGIESMVGLFINTVPVRVELCPSDSVLPWLKKLHARQADRAEYEYASLVDIQGWSDVPRGLPLFESILVFENTPADGSSQIRDALKVSNARSFGGRTGYPLTMIIVPAQEMSLRAMYECDRFDGAAFTRLLEHFKILLEGIVANPEAKLSQLPLLTDAERRQLLIDWNDTKIDYPKDRCIQRLFEAQVNETPDAVAVVFEEQQLSYAELNRSVNRVAHHLTALGVGPEVLVGICVERSIEMVVGLLGILKAGGAYVPLDPSYPKERLSFMLEDTKVLITHSNLEDTLPAHHTHCVLIDRPAAFDQYPITNPKTNATADHLAYVIYTSGSTGRPKGVQIPRRALTNFLQSMREEPGLSDRDVLIAVTTLSFDIAALELFLPLICGARLVLASRETGCDGERLLSLLVESNATVMQATPATWKLLLEAGWSEPAGLKVLCGGEALPPELAGQLLAKGVSLWNLYGPTETTVWSSVHSVTTVEDNIPIGRPIANTSIYLLDRQLNLVPVGVPGELHIGGMGLARGYLKQSVLTEEKFIRNPFSQVPGERLYKTGDLARYRPDGTLECLGRIDHQVKLRGYRIELGEIEATLLRYPGMREAVVVGREDEPGHKALIAYLVQTEQQRNQTPEPEDELCALDMEQVSGWQDIWHDAYKQSVPDSAPDLNFSSWNSSYTGEPIPAEEMREWVECTAARIRSLQPVRVLEIGCGTGLLLYRIAPHCSQYYGVDFAPQALQLIKEQAAKRGLNGVHLLERAAHELDDMQARDVTTVVINSVIQYFPSVDYLMQVLESAVRRVGEQGHIFIGDVRHLPLLETFHSSVQLCRTATSLPAADLLQRVRQAVVGENELVIDPAFFMALKKHLPQIKHVEILHKRGRFHNEMSRYRYDVVLHIGAETGSPASIPWQDWVQENLTLASLRQLLAEEMPEALGVSGVPNARIFRDMQAYELLLSRKDIDTVDKFRSVMREMPAHGVDPEDLWSLGDSLSYRVDVLISPAAAQGCYDVVFRRQGSRAAEGHVLSPDAFDIASSRPWQNYANKPLQEKLNGKLIAKVRRHLQENLPEYMVPSAFMLLDALPLTPNGKLDRKALPVPDHSRPELEATYVAPRTPTEEMLAAIWAEVLKLEKIGMHDNFFALGGHSLLATQVISRVKKTFDADIQLRALFESPTVAGLAAHVAQAVNTGTAAAALTSDFTALSDEALDALILAAAKP